MIVDFDKQYFYLQLVLTSAAAHRASIVAMHECGDAERLAAMRLWTCVPQVYCACVVSALICLLQALFASDASPSPQALRYMRLLCACLHLLGVVAMRSQELVPAM